MHEKGVLTRLFTQNIDTMERLVRSTKKKTVHADLHLPEYAREPKSSRISSAIKTQLRSQTREDQINRAIVRTPFCICHCSYAITQMPLPFVWDDPLRLEYRETK